MGCKDDPYGRCQFNGPDAATFPPGPRGPRADAAASIRPRPTRGQRPRPALLTGAAGREDGRSRPGNRFRAPPTGLRSCLGVPPGNTAPRGQSLRFESLPFSKARAAVASAAHYGVARGSEQARFAVPVLLGLCRLITGSILLPNRKAVKTNKRKISAGKDKPTFITTVSPSEDQLVPKNVYACI